MRTKSMPSPNEQRNADLEAAYDRGFDGGKFVGELANAELLAALQATRQQLADLHAAIADKGLGGVFVDDSINMISEGQSVIAMADTAIDKATGK